MALSFLKILFIVLALGAYAHTAYSQDSQMIIGTGDVLVINVYNEQDLYIKAQVPQSGILRMALIGDVKVVGKTTQELSSFLEQAYLDGYLVSPSVSVVIDSFRPFYVRGAVKTAGAYDFQLDLTVDQAIAIAGGLKDRASKKDWFVLRYVDKRRVKVTKSSRIYPGDILEIEESLF